MNAAVDALNTASSVSMYYESCQSGELSAALFVTNGFPQ